MRAEFVDSVNGPWSHKDHLREGKGRPGSVRGSNSLSMQGREPARNEEEGWHAALSWLGDDRPKTYQFCFETN